jgi:hypothetical protein
MPTYPLLDSGAIEVVAHNSANMIASLPARASVAARVARLSIFATILLQIAYSFD